jgi:hypothetical protein
MKVERPIEKGRASARRNSGRNRRKDYQEHLEQLGFLRILGWNRGSRVFRDVVDFVLFAAGTLVLGLV